ncbi:MAG TPA: hypothetical protein VGJ56_18035 [Reyranella sp.]|jgi:hypothetical protein
MSVTVPLEPGKSGRASRWAARAATTAVALVGLAFAALTVVFVRTFAFEYLHGDPIAMQALTRLVLAN